MLILVSITTKCRSAAFQSGVPPRVLKVFLDTQRAQRGLPSAMLVPKAAGSAHPMVDYDEIRRLCLHIATEQNPAIFQELLARLRDAIDEVNNSDTTRPSLPFHPLKKIRIG